MNAADVMTTNVVTVRPDAPVRAVAETLLKHGVSAVPVVDEHGAPLGVISEGDLMPRNETAREARRDWWLQLLSQGGEVHPDYLQFLKSDHRTAGQIMVSPVVTVDEAVPLAEIADILFENKIKRVPVLREGRVVGIVSRADLLKTLVKPGHVHARDPVHDDGSAIPIASAELEALTHRRQDALPLSHDPAADELSASAFLALGVEHEQHEEEQRREAKRIADEKHHRQASQMLASHLTDDSWEQMMRNARATAKKGEEDHLLLRFPAELCSDHGRAVNAPDPEWPSTLRGMAADIYLRWKAELRPHGFMLHARVVEFPDGIPGDIGLYLSWGKHDAAAH
ncbi:CBS domain-containing protein [Rhodopseudomonas pseudopalustris]|uniref:CBS domain-containing protein n=1 Tax=Rhodopseudomonas pseudopalustris TaxID=1513892 RepID=A0A1H8WVM5_9BRAD|nr:CBS domain-containing protein [Rhodopseudomonas pseudopalustris]SEP31669.1 CBS domain-containing protein [Rhodopseudomonas pseudopalustris]